MREATPNGIKKPATLQVLNKQKRGLFLKESEMLLAGWTATEKHFTKGTVTFGHEHKFGLKNENPEKGILFIKPRICVLIQSPILVEDSLDGNKLVGELGNPQIDQLFQSDKAAAAEDPDCKRRYQARTKSLVYILDKDGNVAHKNPIVLSTKGLNSTEFFSRNSGYGLFLSQVGAAYAERANLPLTNVEFDSAFYSQFIWEPELGAEARGENANEICAVVAQASPTPENLPQFAVNDSVLSFFDQLLEIPGMGQFYLTHAQKEAEKLGGRYGLADNYLAAGAESQMLLESETETITVTVSDDSGEFLAA